MFYRQWIKHCFLHDSFELLILALNLELFILKMSNVCKFTINKCCRNLSFQGYVTFHYTLVY